MASDKHRILFRCIICGRLIRIIISKSKLVEHKDSAYRHVTFHEEPYPHLIIVDINHDGFIVNNIFIKHYADSIKFGEIISKLNSRLVSKLIAYVLLEGKLCLCGSEIVSLVELLKFLFGKDVIDCQKTKLRVSSIEELEEPPIDYKPLVNRVREAMKLKKEFVASYLRYIVRAYEDSLERIKNFILRKKVVDFKKLIEELRSDFSIEEIRFLLAILHYKEPMLAKYLALTELKVFDIVR